jgi:hypothetical protein
MPMDTSANSTPLTPEEFIAILRRIFNIDAKVTLSENTDLAQYIVGSIDLGELLAVLKEEKNIVPAKPELFSKYSKLGDVLAVINGQLNS